MGLGVGRAASPKAPLVFARARALRGMRQLPPSSALRILAVGRRRRAERRDSGRGAETTGVALRGKVARQSATAWRCAAPAGTKSGVKERGREGAGRGGGREGEEGRERAGGGGRRGRGRGRGCGERGKEGQRGGTEREGKVGGGGGLGETERQRR